MRRFVVAVVSVFCLGSAAIAADLPVRQSYPSPTITAPAPVATWTGFYAGGNVGYGWASVSDANASYDLDGVIGGGQIGFNWQSGNFVLGVEGDIQASGQQNSQSLTVAGIGFTVDQDIPWFATARARIGFASGPWLFYGTGGAAWGNYKLAVTALGTTLSDDTTKAAWTAGGGVEWMFAPKWSAKLEYLYVDSGNTTVTLFGTSFDGRVKDHIVRTGVNFHF